MGTVGPSWGASGGSFVDGSSVNVDGSDQSGCKGLLVGETVDFGGFGPVGEKPAFE